MQFSPKFPKGHLHRPTFGWADLMPPCHLYSYYLLPHYYILLYFTTIYYNVTGSSLQDLLIISQPTWVSHNQSNSSHCHNCQPSRSYWFHFLTYQYTNIPIYIYIYTQGLTRMVNWIIFRIHWYCSAIPFHYICISWPILEYSTPEILPWLNSGIFSDFLSRFHTYACNTVTRHPDNLTEITELKLSPWEKSDCFSNIDK